MKFCPVRFGFAAGITMAIAYSICAAFMYFAKESALKMHAMILHMNNMNVVDLQVTPTNYIGGLIQIFIYTFVICWFFALLYNSMCSCKSECKPGSKCSK